MAMICGTGCRWPQHDPPVELCEEKLSFPLEDVFHIVRPFSEVFYFDRKRRCLLVRESVPPGRLPGADDPAQRVVRVFQ